MNAAVLESGLASAAMASATLRLEHLGCVQCGAVVPLTDGESTRCAYCGATTPLPATYRALSATLFSSAEDREITEALYRRLGDMPGPVLRAWSGASTGVLASLGQALLGWLVALGGLLGAARGTNHDGVGGAFVTVFLFVLALPALALVILGVVAAWGWRMLATFALHAPAGPIDPRSMMMLLGLAFIVLVQAPSVVLSRAVARGELKRRVQGTLAARPPERAGGPACCRLCGAPLLVGRGVIGVRCPYCASDNLVALDSAWIALVRSHARASFRTIDAFLDDENRLRVEAHERLFSSVFRMLGVLPFLLLLGIALHRAGFAF